MPTEHKNSRPPSVLAPKTPTRVAYLLRLPIELQLIIWRLIFYQPRTVDIKISKKTPADITDDFLLIKHSRTTFLNIDYHFYTNYQIPTFLHSSKEARYKSLTFYNLSFGYETQL